MAPALVMRVGAIFIFTPARQPGGIFGSIDPLAGSNRVYLARQWQFQAGIAASIGPDDLADHGQNKFLKSVSN